MFLTIRVRLDALYIQLVFRDDLCEHARADFYVRMQCKDASTCSCGVEFSSPIILPAYNRNLCALSSAYASADGGCSQR
jgi:hypothetical protein